MKAMDVLTSAANLQPNGMSQAIAYRLLRHCTFHSLTTRIGCSADGSEMGVGGIKGFQEHGQRVAQFYAHRRNQFEAIAKRHLDGIATWVSPVAG
jgi:tryptophan aminotransferase